MESIQKLKVGVGIAIALALILLGWQLYTQITTSKQPGVMKLSDIRHAAEITTYVALEQGYFEEEGLAVKLISLGGKEAMDGLIKGDIDIVPAMTLISPLQVQVADPGSIKVFNFGGIPREDEEIIEAVVALDSSPIYSLSDLKGKTLAGKTGAFDKFLIIAILKAYGLDPDKDKIEIVEISEAILDKALTSGRVDAVWVTQPRLASLMAQTRAHCVVINPRAKYIAEPFWSGVGVVRTEYARKNPEILLKYLNANDKAIDYIRGHPLEAKMLLSKYTPVKGTIAPQVGIYIKIKSTEEVDLSAVQRIADLFVEAGVLRGRVSMAELYLPRGEIHR